MTITQQIITILAVILGTMTTRFLPFFFFPDHKTPPRYITYLGTVLPFAVMGLLIIYCLKDSLGSAHSAVPQLLGIAFVIILHKWKKNTLFSIGAGTVFYMILVQAVFR